VSTANGVLRIAVGTYVLELQRIKREADSLNWPTSFTVVRNVLVAYMDTVIKQLHSFQRNQIGWRWAYQTEIQKRRKYIEVALEEIGVMES
jgi:hypothetical protein